MKKLYKRTKFVITLVSLAGIFSFGYWLKCQNDLDLVKSFHLGSFLPVQTLQKSIKSTVYANESEYLLDDSFESQGSQDNWSKLWMREEDKVTQRYDSQGIDDSHCLLIESESEKDWSYWHNKIIQVEEGDVFNFKGVVKTQGKEIRANLSIVLYDKNKKVVQWSYAKESVGNTENKWVKLSHRFISPKGIEYIKFGLTGAGIGKSWFDYVKFQKEGKSIAADKELKRNYSLESTLVFYKLDIEKGVISVLDKRINKEWIASNALDNFFILEVKKINAFCSSLKMIDRESLQEYKITINLDQDLAEINYEVVQVGSEKFDKLEFPPIFNLKEKMHIVVPLQEGMLLPADFPVDDFPMRLRYGGGCPMAFIGVIDGERGWIEIIETPNDFEIGRDKDREGNLLMKNRWISEKGFFGYKRKIKFCFFDKGGYVAITKRYRQYANDKGLFKALKEKDSKRKGNISKLIGAVNVWYWGLDVGELADDMAKSGIKRALMSSTDKRNIKKINGLGFLTSKYDIYQDVWPPIYHNVTHRLEGWPEDLVLDQNGNWIKGWVIKKGLKEYPGGVICSLKGLERAVKKIPEDLKDKPYTARFIDTTTCSPWRECYGPKHPTTRSEDVKYKMELLKFCSENMNLVTGSENGVDCAVPYCDYFEGMMSIGIGRLPDSGRNVGAVKYMQPTEKFLKYQIGEKYRIPLWELVYHDAMVTTWYWGDSSNRIPEMWWRKDLFNILYGNMPLWAIRDWDHWKQYKERFIESYNNVSPVFEKVGFEEMLSHKFISDDQMVQETKFTGDIRIVVNFGKKGYTLNNPEYDLPAKGFVVFEKGKVWGKGGYN